MAKRSGVLEFAVLGLLHESPMHGYELRKRLNATLGAFRAFSYGSLYPCLKGLLAAGLVTEQAQAAARPPASGPGSSTSSPPRARSTSPRCWTRAGPVGVGRRGLRRALRLLRPHRRPDPAAHPGGRRSRLEERVDGFRAALARSRERVDTYTLALQQHGLESVEREVRWLNELIDDERRRRESPEHDTNSTDTSSTDTPEKEHSWVRYA